MNPELIPLLVSQKTTQADGICSFELVPQSAMPLPRFSAGAHIDVHVEGLVRQYSLSNSPRDAKRWVIGVQLEQTSRGGSAAMHRLQPGDRLAASHPRNQFALSNETRPVVLIAGGIGITPLLAMAYELGLRGQPFEMHYRTRSPERTAFKDILPNLSGKVSVYHDEGNTPKRFDAAAVLAKCRGETELYVCGPGGFMDWVIATAQAADWPQHLMHSERFSAPNNPLGDGADDAFEICVQSTGLRYTVPAGQSITDALRAQGIDIPVSCEQGVCGTCVTRVIAGQPDHRDVYLTDEEHASNELITPCCSRALSKTLTLDL